MAEKRYKGYKYIYCYCAKHDQIQVGMNAYKYVNAIGTFGGVAFMLWALWLPVDLLTKLTIIFLLGLPAIALPPYHYLYTKKTMRAEGHSRVCSCKIARMYMLRASLWSEFKIMEEKDDGKRVW